VFEKLSSNLSLESKLKYQEYLDANNIDDRIARLQEFISLVPKHKGTEKIVALNKTKLSKLKAEKETLLQRQKSISAAREDPFSIKREGQTIQIMMVSDYFKHIGPGKSTILKNLTGLSDVRPGIFTPEPLVGTYKWEKIKFQLVETPSLHDTQVLSRILAAIRGTDITAIIIDLTRDPIDQMARIIEILSDSNIYLNVSPPPVKLERTGSGGIQLFFLSKSAKKCEDLSDFIEKMVNASGTKNATVKIYEEITISEIEMAFNRSSSYLPAFIIATKADEEGSKGNFLKLKEKYGETDIAAEVKIKSKERFSPRFAIHPVAISYDSSGKEERKGLDDLGKFILDKLNYIRIYTKSKKGVAEKPLILPKDGTIGDVARKVHKDLFNTFKYAMVYREDEKKPIQKIGNDIHVLNKMMKIRAGLQFPIKEDDIIEIYSRI
jgi:ribosome-interacting GTPase 1